MAREFVTVHVKGYREVVRALNRVDSETKKTLLKGMKDAAEPIATDARQKLSRFAGLSTSTIAPRAVTNGVYVTQRAKKRTGQRPDFGSLQMQVGLIPALEDNADDIEDRVDAALGALIRREGF